MSLFDRLLEEHLRPRAASSPASSSGFMEKRAEWLQEAHAKARGEAPSPPPLRRAIEARNAELNALPALPRPPPPAPVNLSGPLVARGSCKAVNPATGIQCALLKGHTKNHRHGNTEFQFSASHGETHFSRRAVLDRHATTRHGSNTGET